MSMDHEVLVRKNEMLRRNIETMLLRENQRGLSSQDQHLKNNFIRELYSNNYQLNHS